MDQETPTTADSKRQDRDLLILTDRYPYGRGEDFLESELSFLARHFNRIYVVPLKYSAGMPQTKQLPANATAHPMSGEPERFRNLRILTGTVTVSFPDLSGFRRIAQTLRHPLRILTNVSFERRAQRAARAALSALETTDLGTRDVVIYAYWFHLQAKVGTILRERYPAPGKALLVSRAHGGDVYESRARFHYLPQRAFLLDSVDVVYPVSRSGLEVLDRRHPGHRARLELQRLGVMRIADQPRAQQSPLHIVSCSSFVPVKRLHILVQAVGMLARDGVPVVWTHFGHGTPDRVEEIHTMARELIPPGVAEFKGAVPNAELLAWYRSHRATVFVNTSSSEGVPVSIMEALAAGIPVVATDVGGTGELLESLPFPCLLPADLDADALADRIRVLAGLARSDYDAQAAACHERWRTMCDAETNYQKFAAELSSEPLPESASADRGVRLGSQPLPAESADVLPDRGI
jgi:glycosyltransferase involved in cell wall biosynthesis